MQYCKKCGAGIKDNADFCPECGSKVVTTQDAGSLSSKGTTYPSRTFYRSYHDKMIAGVCGGLGKYFNVDPTLVRVAFVVGFFAGFGLIAYILLWIFTPVEQP